MYERNPCFYGLLFIYDNFSAEQVSLVLETHNIIIGVQDKNNSIKIRFCVIKIQKICMDSLSKLKIQIAGCQSDSYLTQN